SPAARHARRARCRRVSVPGRSSRSTWRARGARRPPCPHAWLARRGGRGRRPRGSARLLVHRVLTIELAVLLHLDPLAVVLLVLHGDVVPSLAHLAGEGHLDSLLVLGHVLTPLLHSR